MSEHEPSTQIAEPRVRPFHPEDATAVAELFQAYMQETFGTGSVMSPDVLLRDGMGLHFNLVVALDARQQPAGFAAWRMAYDLHHAVAGAEVPDLFVARRHRGRGLSIRLLAAIAQDVQARGGTLSRARCSPTIPAACSNCIAWPSVFPARASTYRAGLFDSWRS